MGTFTKEEFIKAIEAIEYDMGEDFFEYHDLNEDEVRDKILVEFKKNISAEAWEEIQEEDLEMFSLRNLHYRIEAVSEEECVELDKIFYDVTYLVAKELYDSLDDLLNET